ncbi:hypothetical protein V8C34DRAFT_322001 [Trichoderma compactum]
MLAEDGTITLDEEQWDIIAVLPRGKTLYDVTKFFEDAPSRKKKPNLLAQLTLHGDVLTVPDDEWNDGLDHERQRRWDEGVRLYEGESRPRIRKDPTVQGQYVGYSMYMKGPVVIRPGGNTTNSRLQFKVEPDGSIAGRQTIPHYLATMPGNLIALKKWVQGDGEQFSKIREQSVRTGMALGIGAGIAPIAKYRALTDEQFAFAVQHLDEPIYPNRPRGPGNPNWRELVCDGALQRRGTGHMAGFEYGVPYLKALVFPEELIMILHDFALQFPNDFFTTESLLFGLFAWFDCKYGRSRNGEESTEQAWTLPFANLADCLKGWVHFLRWPEEMGLVDYPHFLRYIHQISTADRKRDRLNVQGITSRVKGITPSSRLILLPHMMPGSKMPRMINIQPYRFPTKAELALTGLTSVYLYGLPTYAAHVTPIQHTPLVQLCVPRRLAGASFIGSSKPLSSVAWNLKDLQNPASDLCLITAPFCKGGPVWARNSELASYLFDNPNDRGPLPDLLDTNWSLMDHLSQTAASTYLHQQIQHLMQAQNMGALQIGPGFSLHINAQGFVAVLDAPVEMVLHGEKESLKPIFDEIEESDSEGPSPFVDDVHYVWRRLHESLTTIEDRPEKTNEGLLRAINSSIEMEDEAWQRMRWLEGDPQLEYLVGLIPEALTETICNMAGLVLENTDQDPLSVLWEADEELQELIEQVDKAGPRPSPNLKKKQKAIVETWQQIREMLESGKMAPHLQHVLQCLRNESAGQAAGGNQEGSSHHQEQADGPPGGDAPRESDRETPNNDQDDSDASDSSSSSDDGRPPKKKPKVQGSSGMEKGKGRMIEYNLCSGPQLESPPPHATDSSGLSDEGEENNEDSEEDGKGGADDEDLDENGTGGTNDEDLDEDLENEMSEQNPEEDRGGKTDKESRDEGSGRNMGEDEEERGTPLPRDPSPAANSSNTSPRLSSNLFPPTRDSSGSGKRVRFGDPVSSVLNPPSEEGGYILD